MWATRFLLSITLMGLIHGANSQIVADSFPPSSIYDEVSTSVPNKETKCNYFMAVPTVLRNGQTGQACVFIDCDEATKLDVTLKYKLNSISVFNDQISSFPFFDCRNFPVPITDTPELVYMMFSAIGDTVKKRERKGVVIDKMPEACFVQVEKTKYKPGNIVRSRVFCLNHDLKPTVQNFTRVRFLEPTGACIQIVELQSENYVASVEILLSEDAISGAYNLIFQRESGDPVTKYVTVERYILPRYDSTVTCPNTISVLDKSAKIEIAARYVYDKPLPGTVTSKCCRNVAYTYGTTKNCYRGLEDICVEFTGKLDDTGAYTEDLNLDIFHLQLSEYDSNIQCTITIKESGTGVLDTKYCYMYISSQSANLQLDYSYLHDYYRHGLNYRFAAILKNDKDEPMANEFISIEIDGKQVKTVTTDAQGRAECAIDTTPYYNANFTIRAIYTNENQCYIPNRSRWSPVIYNGYDPGYPYAEKLVKRFFSETDSFLQIEKISGELSCFKTHKMEVEYKVTEDAVGKGANTTTFYYLIKARHKIVLYGQKTVDLTKGCKGSFFLDIFVTPKYAKNTQILVFGATATEIISDTLQMTVNGCFDNQVSLTFSESVVAPGSEVTRELTAAPGSFCGLTAHDASLDTYGSYNSLTSDNLYSSLEYYLDNYQYQQFKLEDAAPPCEDPDTEVYCHGRYFKIVSNPMDGDTDGNLRAMNLIIFSDLRVKKPQVCGMEGFNIPYYKDGPVFALQADSLSVKAGQGFRNADIVTIRKNLDDTFGWQTEIIGPDGKATAKCIIPDTIAKWKSDMFCMSRTNGVGLTNQSAEVITFLGFFVELTMTATCTRGEKPILVTTAANHEDDCKKVEFTVKASDGSQPIPLHDGGNPCICKGQTASQQWSMPFTSLGKVIITASATAKQTSNSCDGANDESKPSSQRIDIVMKNITVEAEGIATEVTSSHLNIVKNSSTKNEVLIEKSDQMVEDSFELYFVVVGNNIGLMVENFNSLVNQPDGCCEQNLAKLHPIALLLNYFIHTSGLKDKIYEKAKSQLIAGYARQLSCRNYDGLYSVFRGSYVANSWLDMNTFYTFEQIKHFTNVDEIAQERTLDQVGKTQDLESGCFTPNGPLFTVSDAKNITILFTAYVAKRLLQSDLYGIGGTMLEGALRCLQDADLESLDIYAIAYIFPAVALAKLEIWYRVYNIVKARAITEGGTVHWRREQGHSGKSYFFLPNVYPSCDVDITASMMLGFLYGPKEDQDEINYLGQIASWLTFSQNRLGGYSSSQDTLVVIEAMTKYGEKVYAGTTNVEVVLLQGDEEVARVTVNEDNKMLVQRRKLPVVFGPYEISTTGTGSPLVQLSAKFHTKVMNEGSPFSITVSTRTDSCTGGVAPVIDIDVCVRYHGSQDKTNIIVIDIKGLTGYSLDQGSVNKYSPPTEKEFYVNAEDNRIQIYLLSMEAGIDFCFSMKSYIDTHALLYQGGTITVRDCYNPGESGSAEYFYPCRPFDVE